MGVGERRGLIYHFNLQAKGQVNWKSSVNHPGAPPPRVYYIYLKMYKNISWEYDQLWAKTIFFTMTLAYLRMKVSMKMMMLLVPTLG